MKEIAPDILESFALILRKRHVPVPLQDDYKKWLQYYLDFRDKYPPPQSRSEHVKAFMRKLREKQQQPGHLAHASHAISLFFEARPELSPPIRKGISTSQPLAPGETSTSTVPRTPASPGLVVSLQEIVEPPHRSGSRYFEWRCLEKTQSPEWDKLIETLAREIKTRHYSRKTLKTYADWCRKFQIYLKDKAPRGTVAG